MVSNTAKEADSLPTVMLTSGEEWNPKVLVNVLTKKKDRIATLDELDKGIIKTRLLLTSLGITST